ncbi:MAG: 50S ribosomal protein L17 [Candidatus Margulisiibacteriota bacterium]|jgi:large subunit ribosomal protein L17
MRHKTGYRKLNKATDQRIALLKSLSRSLFEEKKITTTLTRAKETKKFVDNIITFAKKGTLASRREMLKIMPDKVLVSKIIALAGNMTDRNGGYLRSTIIGRRKGDASLMAVLELADMPAAVAKAEIAPVKPVKKVKEKKAVVAKTVAKKAAAK